MLVINLVPISAGGGLQNTLSFLSVLGARRDRSTQVIVFCTKDSLIEQSCINYKLDYLCIGSGRLNRIYYELFNGYRLIRKHRAKVVFSIFGGAPIFSP